jgi:putative oxidoreductase
MESVASLFSQLRTPLAKLGPWSPTFLRVVLGLTMFWHGWTKFDEGLDKTKAFFDFLGIPAPGLFAVVVAVLELVGGLLILVGLASRLLSLAFIVLLLMAVIRYKYGENIGFIGAQTAGAELDWALIAGFVVLAIGGAGRYSLDHRLGLDRAK